MGRTWVTIGVLVALASGCPGLEDCGVPGNCPAGPEPIDGDPSEFQAAGQASGYEISTPIECLDAADETHQIVVRGDGARNLYELADVEQWASLVAHRRPLRFHVVTGRREFSCNGARVDRLVFVVFAWSDANEVALAIAEALVEDDLYGEVLLVVQGEVVDCAAS